MARSTSNQPSDFAESLANDGRENLCQMIGLALAAVFGVAAYASGSIPGLDLADQAQGTEFMLIVPARIVVAGGATALAYVVFSLLILPISGSFALQGRVNELARCVSYEMGYLRSESVGAVARLEAALAEQNELLRRLADAMAPEPVAVSPHTVPVPTTVTSRGHQFDTPWGASPGGDALPLPGNASVAARRESRRRARRDTRR